MGLSPGVGCKPINAVVQASTQHRMLEMTTLRSLTQLLESLCGRVKGFHLLAMLQYLL